MPASHSLRRRSVAVFFSLLLGVGLLLVRDYGVSWDEPNNHLNGLVNLKYVASLVLSAEQMQRLGMSAQQAAAAVTRQMVGQAYLLASVDLFRLSAWLAAGLILLVWTCRRPSAASPWC